ncbi:MAG: cytochrome P450, partial [Chloroflexi bacterium]|nr:cytochrome P450 [Chloroflexota bacterium]
WMLMSDPPSHTRMRGLVNKAFTPRMIEMIRSRIQTLVDGMLDSVLKNGRLDVIADLADPLPAIVIADLLGVPTEDHSQFKKWSDDIAAGITGTGSVGTQSERFLIAQKSFIELSDYFRGIVEELRGHPEDNLLSALVEAEEAGDKLTEEELFANCVLLMFAGNETTTNLIGNGTLALLRNPVQMQMLQNDGELIGSAIEELLRFDSPVQKLGRLATADIEIGGKVIKSGELVWLCYGAANRDPEQFSKPDQLDITRSDNRHVAFAQGIHYCLGASLARLEGQIAIGTLLKRIPEIKLTSEELEWNPSTVLRGLKALPVAF